MRNILARMPQKGKAEFAAGLKGIWTALNEGEARERTDAGKREIQKPLHRDAALR